MKFLENLKINNLFSKKKLNENLLDRFEELLIESDVGIETASDLKEKFKTVRFGISCDHFGEKLEYIRYPIDHKQFEENLKFIIENFPHSINGTVGLLNIDELDEIEEYYKNLGAKMNFNNIVIRHRLIGAWSIIILQSIQN